MFADILSVLPSGVECIKVDIV
ncbi:hypothetical protein CBM2589_A90231 [Cupriavidus taiwanensis]|uniref:Uncharacterized protein n=1 Tax=Cupriavidus taiwanensis TaxID=164546 RepID=A0A975XIE8_9BURK|nr:hypothetical protein CBM2589_A90231 [Cupriavidus taiwanensis]